MLKNLKIFLIVCILVWPLWMWISWLEKEVENFFYWQKVSKDPQLLIGQIFPELKVEFLRPFRNWEIENLEIAANSALSVFVDEKGEKRVLFEKNIDEKLPIASLTKLMTAAIVLEYYDISQISDGELLYPLLIESNNDAAIILAGIIGEEAFVDLMNLEAKNLGLNNTYFANPTGLDPDFIADPINYSTVRDLAKFARYLTTEKPLIWDISTIPEFGNATNTNELLGKISGIIGGKTGETPRAGECFLLVVGAPKNKGYVINVILNSKNHFEEMEKLIGWVKYAYKW